MNSRKRSRNRPTAQRANINSHNRSFWPLAAAPIAQGVSANMQPRFQTPVLPNVVWNLGFRPLSSPNERFPRDFRKNWDGRLPKQAFSTRLSKKLRRKTSKRSVFHETFPKTENPHFQNECFPRDFPKNWESFKSNVFHETFAQTENEACQNERFRPMQNLVGNHIRKPIWKNNCFVDLVENSVGNLVGNHNRMENEILVRNGNLSHDQMSKNVQRLKCKAKSLYLTQKATF